MPVSAATLRRIAALPPETMGEMLLILADQEAMEEERREKQRERTRRYRDRNVTVTSLERDVQRDVSPEQRNSPAPPKETQPLSKKTLPTEGQKKVPADEFVGVLDGKHAMAVVEHRARLRKPLTLHAASLLAGKFSKCADPNGAADAMIANGWQGFEPEWLERAARPNGTGPPVNGHAKPPSSAQEAYHVLERYKNSADLRPKPPEPDIGTGATIETRDYRRVG